MQGVEPSRRSSGATSAPEEQVLLAITVIRDLVAHARSQEMPLADEVLTDVLARLSGWPVEELDRLR